MSSTKSHCSVNYQLYTDNVNVIYAEYAGGKIPEQNRCKKAALSKVKYYRLTVS